MPTDALRRLFNHPIDRVVFLVKNTVLGWGSRPQ